MQVTLETLDGLERRIKVEVPAEKVDLEIESRLRKLVGQVRIDGFRPGKVPVSIVRQRYGNAVRGEVVNEVIRSTYVDVLQKEHLNPAGDPHMDLTTMEAGKPLIYTATFEVYPSIQLKAADEMEVEVLEAQVTDADIAKMLEKLRKQHAHWHEVERSAAMGDKLVIDFEGYMDDKAFEGGSAEDIQLELGSGMMIPGFEQGLIGVKAGDKVSLNLHFPKDYHAEQYADKPARFEVTVQKVLEIHLPDVDDSFADKLGIKEGGLESLRKEIRANMERELKRVLRNRVKDQVLEKFLKLHFIELPKVLINNEVSRLQSQAKQHYKSQTGAKEVPDLPAEHFLEAAQQRVSLGLLFAEFIKAHEIKADEQRVKAMIEEAASVYQHPEQVVAWYYQNKQQLAQLESLALEEQVIDMLLEKAKVTINNASYEDVMNHQEAE